MSQILVAGVSTRKYARVLPAMAHAAGISKSALSRQFKMASQATLRALMERSFAKLEVLAVYLDGIQIGGYHVLAAVGLDDTGKKHLLGLARGASENARVVKDLLDSLVKRGIDASRQRLFVIDGGKALRKPAYAKYYIEAETRSLLERAGFSDVTLYHRRGYSWTAAGRRATAY